MAKTKERIGPKDLGIDPSTASDAEAFRWLIACDLFGARISQEIAARAFAELDAAGMLTPETLAGADWQTLVDLLGKGGYRRYDESTARGLIAIGRLMRDKYDGSMAKLRDAADDEREIRRRLQEFTGVGPTAAGIFLREMPADWKN